MNFGKNTRSALVVTMALALSLFPAQAEAGKGSEKPNIIILLADDLGRADLGYRGSDIQTPNIDRLAREGMRLERFYTMPICTPTRSALLTGRDPMKLGLAYAGLQPWENGGIAPQEHLMPQSFKAAGYQTAMVGKWHLGRSYESLVPHHRGFDHFYGHLNTQVTYFEHKSTGGHDLQENGVSVNRDGEYATDIHGSEAVRYLTELRDKDKPFFLYVPFLAPHSPMEAPESLRAKYQDTRRDLPFPKKTYAAMVDSMDQAIGKILAAVDAEGIADNTIILFFSDNGGFAGFGGDNTPLRGGKLETFEGGIRVNAVIRWPELIAQGSVSEDIFSVMDVFPTFAKAANIDMLGEKPLDGRSRMTVLEGGRYTDRPGKLFFASNSPEYNMFQLSVIDGNDKLVQIIDHTNTGTMIENYLFNLEQDPEEQNNLAETNPLLVKKLAREINDWRAGHPVSGLLVSISPHPAWRAPKDFAEDIRPDDKTKLTPYQGFGTLATQVLQRRYGDKGRIEYK